VAASAILFFALLSGYHSQYCDSHPQTKGKGVRAIDFCNFEFPGVKLPYDDPGEERIPPHFKLAKGVREPGQSHKGELITLEEIKYVDVTRDGREEAIVTLLWHSGGTMELGLIYVWSLKDPAPALLWSFSTGDRADGGLHEIYGKDGNLVLELNDPESAIGLCCARRFIRTRYRWDDAKFVPQGKPQKLPNPDFKDLPADEEKPTSFTLHSPSDFLAR
jgi:hypothetical protein